MGLLAAIRKIKFQNKCFFFEEKTNYVRESKYLKIFNLEIDICNFIIFFLNKYLIKSKETTFFNHLIEKKRGKLLIFISQYMFNIRAFTHKYSLLLTTCHML